MKPAESAVVGGENLGYVVEMPVESVVIDGENLGYIVVIAAESAVIGGENLSAVEVGVKPAQSTLVSDGSSVL